MSIELQKVSDTMSNPRFMTKISATLLTSGVILL